ncbi:MULTISPECIES: terminase gpA endonuclease subunit [unclassified Campylobacter]|uniref:terminase gpA endonuclease subunit n=1 Tax=unclassified Campylobacter TaxID=2593542 RepID=UPI001D570A24|nr:phage terminase large subunit family protein [Campylobacter sp. RM9331]MBZ8005200.1 phage terminase large subunit family protein [Campylobacter sp. RM9332]
MITSVNYDLENTKHLYSLLANSIFTKPHLDLLAWSEKYRFLSAEGSARPGRFKAASYQREILTTISDKEHKRVVLNLASQLGKTEMCLNTLAYLIAHDPTPILYMLPDEGMAEDFSKRRFAPLKRDCKEVAKIMGENASDTILIKNFKGGSLNFVGSNSVSKLASKPIGFLIVDEVDRCSNTAEGDSVALAEKRTITFPNAKILLVSTPTLHGTSKIQNEYDKSDKRRFYVPCPKCEFKQVLEWENVDLDKECLVCISCKYEISERERLAIIKKGEWIKECESDVAGFHLSSLYSEYVSLKSIIKDYKDKCKSEAGLQVFINTTLARTYTPKVESKMNESDLIKLKRDYDNLSFSSDVAFIVAGVDVQKDRLEVNFAGANKDLKDLRVYNITHKIIKGNPRELMVWDKLHELVQNGVFMSEVGEYLKCSLCFVDSGYLTEEVYNFVARHKSYFATKGANETSNNKKLLVNKVKAVKSGVGLIEIGTFTGKSEVFAMIENKRVVFAKTYSDEYFKQLTAESLKVVKNKYGDENLRFTKDRDRNEALDLSVLNIAAIKTFLSKKKRNIKQ